MSFFRLLLILIGTAISFVIGGDLTQGIGGALVFAVMALFLMVIVTKPLKKRKQIPVSLTQIQEGPKRKSGKTVATVGRVVWTIVTAVGVSGVIAILKYVEDQKDRDRDRRTWAEQHYQQREDQLRQQLSSSIAGRTFDRQTNAPLANAAIGYMSHQGFVELARTAPDGSFRINIPYSSAHAYPIRIVVIPSGGTIYQTDKYLQSGQKMQNVNIYLFNQAYR